MVLMLVFAMSCHKTDEPNHGGENNDEIIDTLEYVDLGLPSGNLWATCNVGAETPESCGDYFAWGETSPKELYDWKSYIYGNYIDERYRFEVSKYCTDSFFGVDGLVDSLTVLEAIDDAVVANWGKCWRMPTKEDWEELLQKTTNTWVTQNGVKGRLLTSWNGNSIFLPATGFYLDGELICPNLGIYWSSSLYTGSPERAWSFHYDYDECHVCGTYERSRGHCVRAVRSL